MGNRTYPFDSLLLMKDAGLVATSAAATVGGDAKILDVGQARVDMACILDITAVEIASNNEEFDIIVQGSSSPTFASDVQNLAQMNLGATEVRQGGAVDSLAGRYELLFTNQQAEITYRYLRIYTVVAGTIADGINYTAWFSELPLM